MRKLKELKENNKGFTLIELIIVISIIAVLSVIIAPQYIRFVENAKEASDLSAANTFVEASTLAIISSNEVPPGHVIEIIWAAGEGARKDAYDGYLLFRSPERLSTLVSTQVLGRTPDAVVASFAKEVAGLLNGGEVKTSREHGFTLNGYASFLGYAESQVAQNAAFGIHIDTTTGEVVLASFKGNNGNVNDWIDIGVNLAPAP